MVHAEGFFHSFRLAAQTTVVYLEDGVLVPGVKRFGINVGVHMWKGTARARLDVYDVLGRRVTTLRDGFQAAGAHAAVFSAAVPGTYFAVLTTQLDRIVEPFIVVR